MPQPLSARKPNYHRFSIRRVALPLGYSDAALVSTDLRSPAALSYSLTPLGATSLVGRTLATGRTGVLEGDG